METQNVSAQLYFKQLANQAGNQMSDASIEDAFQKQLDLSEYYKSPGVFEKMKSDYMDKTMEGSDTPPKEVPVSQIKQQSQIENTPRPTPKNTPVGPRDFLNKNKSTFGSSSTGFDPMTVILILIICIAAYFFYEKVIKK